MTIITLDDSTKDDTHESWPVCCCCRSVWLFVTLRAFHFMCSIWMNFRSHREYSHASARFYHNQRTKINSITTATSLSSSSSSFASNGKIQKRMTRERERYAERKSEKAYSRVRTRGVLKDTQPPRTSNRKYYNNERANEMPQRTLNSLARTNTQGHNCEQQPATSPAATEAETNEKTKNKNKIKHITHRKNECYVCADRRRDEYIALL